MLSLVFIIMNLLSLVLIDLVKAPAVNDLDYSRLESLGASCYPTDTCNSDASLSFHNRTCQCDSLCQFYDDCCIDASAVTSKKESQREVQNIECLTFESPIKGVYAISKCDGDYSESLDIQDKCENLEDMSDPLAAAPVVDILFNVTYKNRYCAECNFARQKDLRSWGISVECSDIPDNTSIPVVDSKYVKKNLVYVESGEYSNNWGFYYRPTNKPASEDLFYPCKLPFIVPDSLRSHVRECVPNVVSTCASSWERNIHQYLCQTYMAVVYVDFQVFRNPDCALCNMKDMKNLKCTIPEMIVSGRRKQPSLTFPLLLYVNYSDDPKNDQCPEGQKWDKSFKKCRSPILGCSKQNNTFSCTGSEN